MHQFLVGKKEEFEHVVSFLEKELASVRTGRANVALVEGLMVSAYGSDQELKNMAAISTPDAQTIQIEPWDAGVVGDIEKAILESHIGISPTTAGKTIRLSIPPLTEETRKGLVKVVGKKVEEARISVRNVRDGIKKQIEAMEKEKEVSEDERYQMQEELEDMVGGYNDSISKLGKDKEEQIMTV